MKSHDQMTNFQIGLPCTYFNNFQRYFNRQEVKAALNVDVSIKWDLCIFHKWGYKSAPEGSMPSIKALLGQINILIYTGDADSAVPMVDSVNLLK
jgi:hypothetical protein